MNNKTPEVADVLENLTKYMDQGPISADAPMRGDQQQLYDNAESRYQNALHVSKAFSTPAGKATLELLMDQTIRNPSWNTYTTTEAALTNGLYREGQNSIMRLIFEYFLLAEQGPPSPPKLTKNPLKT